MSETQSLAVAAVERFLRSPDGVRIKRKLARNPAIKDSRDIDLAIVEAYLLGRNEGLSTCVDATAALRDNIDQEDKEAAHKPRAFDRSHRLSL